jgi:hypothetical protein
LSDHNLSKARANWFYSPFRLIDTEKGETKAQACAIVGLRLTMKTR